jgi:hypothetical protein
MQVMVVLTHLFLVSRVLVVVLVEQTHQPLLVVQEVLVVVDQIMEQAILYLLVDLALQDKEIQEELVGTFQVLAVVLVLQVVEMLDR